MLTKTPLFINTIWVWSILLVMGSALPVLAQEHTEEHVHRKHRLTIGLGHAHIPTGIKSGDGELGWLNLGSFAFDYDFYLHPRWAIGIHSDIVPTQYEVEFSLSKDDEIVSRTSPLSTLVTGTYKVTEHLGIQLGYGIEYTKEETLNVLRAGIEYGWELPKDFEFGIGLTYDDKINAYNTWFLGFMVSKWLGKPHEQN